MSSSQWPSTPVQASSSPVPKNQKPSQQAPSPTASSPSSESNPSTDAPSAPRKTHLARTAKLSLAINSGKPTSPPTPQPSAKPSISITNPTSSSVSWARR